MNDEPFIVGYFDPHDKSIGSLPIHLDLASMLVAMEDSGLQILSVRDGHTELLGDRSQLTRLRTLGDIIWGKA